MKEVATKARAAYATPEESEAEMEAIREFERRTAEMTKNATAARRQAAKE